MTGRQMFTSRLRGRPLLDSEGLTIGRIRDVVILPSDGNDPPRALGLIVTLQRRRIFVNLGQVTEISVDGAHLLGGAGELDRFIRRAGEMLASELYGRRTEDGTIVDVAVSPSKYQRPGDEELADLLEEMPEQDQVPAAGRRRARAQRRRSGRDAAGRRRGPARRTASRAA